MMMRPSRGTGPPTTVCAASGRDPNNAVVPAAALDPSNDRRDMLPLSILLSFASVDCVASFDPVMIRVLPSSLLGHNVRFHPIVLKMSGLDGHHRFRLYVPRMLRLLDKQAAAIVYY